MPRRRVPAKERLKKFLLLVLPAFLVLCAGVLGFFGFIIYRITHPGRVPEAINPSHYSLPSLDVSCVSDDGMEFPAWWIPGLKGAPGILLSPGYGMSRADVLSLAAMLREQGFNILVYDQRGSGASPRGASTLGFREAADMTAALEFLRMRPEVNSSQLGIWGVDVGARAALLSAATSPEVRAVAADSAYVSTNDFLTVRIRQEIGNESPALEFGCRQVFRLSHMISRRSLLEGIPLEALADRSILFIQGENRQEMARLTAVLYDGLKPQKEIITLPAARVRIMGAEELKDYDRQVSNFFRLNLPPKPSNG